MQNPPQADFFGPAHNWQHVTAPTRYTIGRHVLATCECGGKSIGVTTGTHGKLDAIETEPTSLNRLVCRATGRDHSERAP